MHWTLPGTTIAADTDSADWVEEQLHTLFLAGGLTLSQVSKITDLETYCIQNWVKRGYLAPPVNKRYSIEQLCRILNINLLKGIMPLEQILRLMEYLNGDLVDESDDIIDDTLLYCFFVRLAVRSQTISTPENWEETLNHVIGRYEPPVPGAEEKLKKVLRIMLTVWFANQLKTKAEEMVETLETKS